MLGCARITVDRFGVERVTLEVEEQVAVVGPRQRREGSRYDDLERRWRGCRGRTGCRIHGCYRVERAR